MRSRSRIRTLLDTLVQGDVPIRELLRSGFSVSAYRLVGSIAHYCSRFATIIDVGANIGQFALAAARRFPSAVICSFEPLPDVAAELRRKVSRRQRIKVFECALGSQTQELSFFRNDYTPVSSALVIPELSLHPDYSQQNARKVRVQCFRLDALKQEVGFVPPVLLKLDVQGYEQEVLGGAGAVLDGIEWIVVESAFVQLYENQPLFDSTHSLLNRLGYRFVAPMAFNEGRGHAIIEMDSLYRKNRV